MQPFSDCRVLDASLGIAGAYATKLLADQGADVLKLEHPSVPDPLRRRTAARIELPPGEDSALFRFLNAGKRSAFVPGERADLESLLEQADLVVESGPIEVFSESFGSFDALRERYPRLSIVSISPWGRSGPYAQRPASEWTLQAATGFMARRGRPERGHIGAGGMLGEYAAGSFAAAAAVSAWRMARSTQRGRHADVSMFESMLICGTQYWDLQVQFIGGSLGQYQDIPAIEPAKDGWVGFAPTTSDQWQAFCLMIGRPEIFEDKANLTADKRQANFDFLSEAITSWTRARGVDEILEQCELLRIPCATVGNGERLPETDHFKARGIYVENPHGFIQPRVPMRLSEFEPLPVRRAPRAGEHALAWMSPPAESEQSVGNGFEGLRVVDLTAFWAGPFTTLTMAALGADVIKIESPSRPDGMRFVNAKPDVPIWEGGCIFHGANTDKRALALDLVSEGGKALLKRLIENADLLVENFSARVLGNLGLEPEKLFEWNPRLIVLRMPAWGLDGPWVNRTGFAMNVEQASGIAWRAGYEEQPLTANYCDPVGALHAIVAASAALEHRERTGRGQLIEVPLAEPALNLAAEQVIEFSAYGVLLHSEGNRGPDCAPQGIYRCSDARHVALSVGCTDEWEALAGVMREIAGAELPALFGDAALNDEAVRHRRHDEIDAAINAVTEGCAAMALVEQLTRAGVPAELLISGFDVMPHPQLEARGFFRELDHPLTGRNRYPGLPIVGLADGSPRLAPPTFGQHNAEVLGGELGLSGEELERLETEGVAVSKPSWA